MSGKVCAGQQYTPALLLDGHRRQHRGPGDIHRYTEPQMNRINAAVVYFSRVNTLWPIIVGVALGLLSRTLGANWF
ncbi:hypothetical protein QNM99_26140 [Pseudomonas sp. PCH446]